MAEDSWHFAGADAGGFVAFEVLQDRARQASLEQFIEEFPVPGALVIYKEPEGGPGAEVPNTGVQLLTVSVKSTAILQYLNRYAFLCKRPGNPFAHLISIGRSTKNDISINVDSVSKVHGYFSCEGEDWSFTDHGSTNGSMLNGTDLDSGAKQVLRDGDLLRLGLEVNLEIFMPRSLYERARR